MTKGHPAQYTFANELTAQSDHNIGKLQDYNRKNKFELPSLGHTAKNFTY